MRRYIKGLGRVIGFLSHWGGWTASSEHSSNVLDKSILLAQKIFKYTVWAGEGVHPGVIMFIIISGFSIHLPLAIKPELSNRDNFWKDFALRRIFRLVPLLWFATLLGVASLALVMHYPEFRPNFVEDTLNWSDLFLNLTLINGFLLPFYTYNGLGNPILGTVYSIMVLYTFYPIVLRVLHRGGWCLVFVLAVILHILAMVFLLIGFKTTSVIFSYFIFFLYWWMGAFLAELFIGSKQKNDNTRWSSNFKCESLVKYKDWIIAIGFFILYLLISFYVNFKGSFIFKNILLGFTMICMMKAWLMTESGRKKPISQFSKAMLFVGQRSFSLYAVHTPIITMAIVALGITTLSGRIMERLYPLLAVIIVTLISYRYIEKPSHMFARYFSNLLK